MKQSEPTSLGAKIEFLFILFLIVIAFGSGLMGLF